jgi:hypothetical protein
LLAENEKPDPFFPFHSVFFLYDVQLSIGNWNYFARPVARICDEGFARPGPLEFKEVTF